MHVNVFYLLVKEKRLRKADQELGIGLVAIGINIAIVASSIFEIMMRRCKIRRNEWVAMPDGCGGDAVAMQRTCKYARARAGMSTSAHGETASRCRGGR